MAAERNDFNINLGDTIYSDSELGGEPALTLAAKWAKYRLGLSPPNLRALRAGSGLYSHWDDHEFVNDFATRTEHGDPLYATGVKAFMDYTPVSYTRENGLYRTFRWGRHLELFFLDERSFRSGKVNAACGGDLAPTAPKPVRDAFAALVPALASPVAQSPRRDRRPRLARCSARPARGLPPRDPCLERDVQGDRQRGAAAAVLRAAVRPLGGVRRRSRAPAGCHRRRAERHRPDHGCACEPDRRDPTADTEGPPLGTGVWEVVTGPAATRTYAKEIDQSLESIGLGDFVTSVFLKPAPPRGSAWPARRPTSTATRR